MTRGGGGAVRAGSTDPAHRLPDISALRALTRPAPHRAPPQGASLQVGSGTPRCTAGWLYAQSAGPGATDRGSSAVRRPGCVALASLCTPVSSQNQHTGLRPTPRAAWARRDGVRGSISTRRQRLTWRPWARAPRGRSRARASADPEGRGLALSPQSHQLRTQFRQLHSATNSRPELATPAACLSDREVQSTPGVRGQPAIQALGREDRARSPGDGEGGSGPGLVLNPLRPAPDFPAYQ